MILRKDLEICFEIYLFIFEIYYLFISKIYYLFIFKIYILKALIFIECTNVYTSVNISINLYLIIITLLLYDYHDDIYFFDKREAM